MRTTKAQKAPWKKPNPRRRAGSSVKLSASQKASARRAAAEAGRPYPNLVDNMHAAAAGKRRKPAKAKASKRVLKNPRGGLTAAGRAEFRKRDGAHLRPGVRKSEVEMTPLDKKRKGSWAVRFYGRTGKLPPLIDKHGKPTRFALSAAAWGERVPKTVAAARKIAAKGRRLLARYQNEKRKSSRTA